VSAAIAAGSDAARAIAMLQQLAALCDETTRTARDDPARITTMLESFEETLALLAPVFEALGRSPGASLDAVWLAASTATDRHQALLRSMRHELDRLSRAITDVDLSSRAVASYGSCGPEALRGGFEAHG
jgi:hypothetical protein